ncbi:MAG: hypothetical protein ABW049_02280 [Spongiibacteraceae bacterium]
MNMLTAFVIIAAAVLVWWLLLQKLRAKSWLPEGAVGNADFGSASFDATAHSPKIIALGVFLAVVTALFGLFAAAYHMRMAVPDWTHLPLPKILWVNTFLLAASSVALQWAWFASVRVDSGRSLSVTRHALMAGACLTLTFFVGQWQAWQQLDASGFYFSCTPASAFFYLLSGLHAVHLFGGLLVLTKTMLAVYRVDGGAVCGGSTIDGRDRAAARASPALSIKLCALYWHYLLVLWLALYALLALT